MSEENTATQEQQILACYKTVQDKTMEVFYALLGGEYGESEIVIGHDDGTETVFRITCTKKK